VVGEGLGVSPAGAAVGSRQRQTAAIAQPAIVRPAGKGAHLRGGRHGAADQFVLEKVDIVGLGNEFEKLLAERAAAFVAEFIDRDPMVGAHPVVNGQAGARRQLAQFCVGVHPVRQKLVRKLPHLLRSAFSAGPYREGIPSQLRGRTSCPSSSRSAAGRTVRPRRRGARRGEQRTPAPIAVGRTLDLSLLVVDFGFRSVGAGSSSLLSGKSFAGCRRARRSPPPR
jgi:hypothetical protein